jgi:hypothetical protein
MGKAPRFGGASQPLTKALGGSALAFSISLGGGLICDEIIMPNCPPICQSELQDTPYHF